jgi:hypothetical protein
MPDNDGGPMIVCVCKGSRLVMQCGIGETVIQMEVGNGMSAARPMRAIPAECNSPSDFLHVS